MISILPESCFPMSGMVVSLFWNTGSHTTEWWFKVSRNTHGDAIMYIYGCYMKECGKFLGNKVVTTVMSNLGLYKALDAKGIEYEKTAVGDKYVYENMNTNGYRIGGEQLGHIIFKKYAITGDGILTALKMMEVMLEKKAPLSKLREDFVVYSPGA